MNRINQQVGLSESKTEKSQEVHQPKKYKLAIIAWLAIYPAITIIFWIFEDWLIMLPLVIRTFILTAALVPFMFFVGMPLLTKILSKWLF